MEQGAKASNKYLFSVDKQLWFWLGVAFVLLVVIGLSRIIYPYDAGQYEACIWAPASLLIHGHDLYHPYFASHEPYTMSPYGILYYLMVGIGIKLFGLQFWFARAISLACVMVCTLCIAKLIYRHTANGQMALLGMLLFMAQFPVQFWVGIQRPDLLALAFSLLGIASALTIDPARNSYILVIIQAMLISGAILVRQTCLLPVLVIYIWYWANRAYYKLYVFLSAVFIFTSVVMLWLNRLSDGGYIWQQFILHSYVHKDFAVGLHQLMVFLTAPITIASLALWAFFLVQGRRARSGGAREGDPVHGPLYRYVILAYLSIALLLAAVTASRRGANLNYYLEVSAVLSVIIPLYGSRAGHPLATGRIYPILLLMVGLSFSIRGLQVCRGEYFRWGSKKYYDEIVSVVKEKTAGAEPSYSVYPELVALAGRQYFFNDFVQYSGRAPLQKKIFDIVMVSGRLAAIITGSQDVPPGYYRYKMSTPLPQKFYLSYLYLRNPPRAQIIDSLSTLR